MTSKLTTIKYNQLMQLDKESFRAFLNATLESLNMWIPMNKFRELTELSSTQLYRYINTKQWKNGYIIRKSTKPKKNVLEKVWVEGNLAHYLEWKLFEYNRKTYASE